MQYLKKSCAAVFVAAVLAVLSVSAQQQQGLVNVNLSDIRADVAKNINVNVSQVPVTVQVPIDVAATVCGVDVSVLTNQAKSGSATCTARNDTQALNQIVQSQINQQSTGGTPKAQP